MSITPSDMICFSLYSASHAMQHAYRPLLEPLRLTYPQYLVLRALWSAAGPLAVGDIGTEVHLESSTLTPLLKRMEAAGLVRRNRDTGDERRVLIALTETGAALEAQAAHVPGCIVERTGMTEDALADLQNGLAALTRRLRGQKDTVKAQTA